MYELRISVSENVKWRECEAESRVEGKVKALLNAVASPLSLSLSLELVLVLVQAIKGRGLWRQTERDLTHKLETLLKKEAFFAAILFVFHLGILFVFAFAVFSLLGCFLASKFLSFLMLRWWVTWIL
ncbi:hypothetical protein VNO78_13611 [Psophocarpus tetragonolobus]|uniref:Uncharacterized protein n=1 Tax=Psophocarpus tetragonolobus TaxID=3891 RepID=A0AAN9SPA6_PSOTE